MLPDAKNTDLIYAIGGCNGTCVFSYPKGKLVGTLSTNGDGICSDGNGNVFIAYDDTVTEYAHGGTTPIATLSLPGNNAGGCAVDPTTGNLTVIFRTNGADIAVFPAGQQSSTLYLSQIDSQYCGYDNEGNLFVNGYDGQQPGFSELRSGQSNSAKLAIDSSVGLPPGQVQWDGQHITYQSRRGYAEKVSQLEVTGSAVTVVGTVQLSNGGHVAMPSWIFGSHIAMPYSNRGTAAQKVGIWQYPQGGTPAKNIKGPQRKTYRLQGVTVSVAPSR